MLALGEVDKIKAFFIILLGGVGVAVTLYIYDSTINPWLMRMVPNAASAPATGTMAQAA